jgi:hypothetical protein
MVGKFLDDRAIHEASHAVIARKLGIAVHRVTVVVGNNIAVSESAAYVARDRDVRDRIAANEKDALVALAGWEANRLEHPDAPALDLLTDDEAPDDDVVNARGKILHMILLEEGKPTPAPGTTMGTTIDEAMVRKLHEIWVRLLRTTHGLVKRHWPAIERVAKHLERHRCIDDQAELDDLIARAERLAGKTETAR